MRYPDYEDLLADSRPSRSNPSAGQQDLVFDGPELEALLTESHEQEQNRIETELTQVETRLQHRTEIHDQTIAELKTAIQEEQDRLERLQRPSIPIDRLTDQKRRVRELEQQLQEAKRTHWRDRDQLERERRHLHRELRELTETDLSAFF